MAAVTLRRGPLSLPTYLPHAPDKNPMFLEKRVYQGSSGKVYPLPFTDRVALERTEHAWDAIELENRFIRVVILPELGGRIHAGQDKTNGYDFFYRQPVIKPALVGLAGPWISGGVEFNWPQHHRPSTFMPADVAIEEHADGAKTIWLSEHDPMARMKGMHGICLHPDRACIELKVRLYNRTPLPQTFLWWANVATRVHERYQSFFPPDAHYVADHAKRAMSAFPLCTGRYYGIDYAARAKHGVPAAERPRLYVPPGDYLPNDLSWYANIPVPTSYMCMGSAEDFFGGYDHAQRAGVVHVANHHVAPGKKQWTWGNHEFGYAWDRNLTDPDERGECAPYIELMAGVFTDNQPDFSFLQPGETKAWSQCWYPIQEIGAPQHANLDAALALRVEGRHAHIGVSPTVELTQAHVTLRRASRALASFVRDLAPGKPLRELVRLPHSTRAEDLSLTVVAADGREVIAYRPASRKESIVPPAATEPAPPEKIQSNDELYLTGLHLEQYRHATRRPELYWEEALRRDPGDARCHLALGRWRLQRGEFPAAERHLRAAITRLTARNPNPSDGEAHYTLGLTLRHLHRDDEAYAAFYKATWNHAWQAAGYHALAEIDCTRRDWPSALGHLEAALRVNTENLRARNLRVLVLRELGRPAEATRLLAETRALDPLDWWARHLAGETLTCDNQVRLDLALDLARAGLFDAALNALDTSASGHTDGTAPLIEYYRAWLQARKGETGAARRALRRAAAVSPDYCFPARLEEIAILEFALAENPRDARAPHYLGNLLYDRRRFSEAIRQWEHATKLDPRYSVGWRNLGLAYFNIERQPRKARAAYERALATNPADARLLYERDQLWKRIGVAPAVRRRELQRHAALVAARDDLSLELAALHNQLGDPDAAQAVLDSRRFQPWEGGEGMALGQFVRTQIALGRRALVRGNADEAERFFATALTPPESLGEMKHLLANQAEIFFWLGESARARGDHAAARRHYREAAAVTGDFQEMSVRDFSELSYFAGRALHALGEAAKARRLFRGLLAHARRLAASPAKIDYFATSLPTMLVFEEDLARRQRVQARFLEALAHLGMGDTRRAQGVFRRLLRDDPNHAAAADFLRWK